MDVRPCQSLVRQHPVDAELPALRRGRAHLCPRPLDSMFVQFDHIHQHDCVFSQLPAMLPMPLRCAPFHANYSTYPALLTGPVFEGRP